MIIQKSTRLRDERTYYFALKLAEIAKINAEEEEGIINLGIGSPDIAPPSYIIEELKKDSEHPDSHRYQPYKGISELRESFSKIESLRNIFGATW